MVCHKTYTKFHIPCISQKTGNSNIFPVNCLQFYNPFEMPHQFHQKIHPSVRLYLPSVSLHHRSVRLLLDWKLHYHQHLKALLIQTNVAIHLPDRHMARQKNLNYHRYIRIYRFYLNSVHLRKCFSQISERIPLCHLCAKWHSVCTKDHLSHLPKRCVYIPLSLRVLRVLKVHACDKSKDFDYYDGLSIHTSI